MHARNRPINQSSSPHYGRRRPPEVHLQALPARVHDPLQKEGVGNRLNMRRYIIDKSTAVFFSFLFAL